MATRRKTRSVTALEELYWEKEDDSVTETASDDDDAKNEEAESSHASETDADEDETMENRKKSLSRPQNFLQMLKVWQGHV